MAGAHSQRPRSARGSGHLLRDEILRSASQLIANGAPFEDLSLRAVARDVGVSPASIYRHFRDRQALVAAIVSDAFARLESRLRTERERAPADVSSRLRATAGAYLAFSREDPRHFALMFELLAEPDPHLADGSPRLESGAMVGGIGTSSFQLLLDAVRECMRSAGADDGPAFAEAAALWAGLHGYAVLGKRNARFPWPDSMLDVLLERIPGYREPPSRSPIGG